MGCPEWTGVRLRDVLKHCGIKSDAVYTGYYAADTHLSGNPEKDAISRGVPIEKALEKESLIAFAMNGKDIPWLNGHPLRIVTGGWPASTSGKWVNKIVIRNKEKAEVTEADDEETSSDNEETSSDDEAPVEAGSPA